MRSRQRSGAARSRRAIAGVYESFVRTAGIAKEKVARGNLLQILTAGDDVEDEDEDIAMPKPSTIATRGRRRPKVAGSKGPYSTWRTNPPVDFLQMQGAEPRCAIGG
jgi:hypothetical protein